LNPRIESIRDRWPAFNVSHLQEILENRFQVENLLKLNISSRLLLQVKVNAEGEVDKLKARLVGHGFKQRPGIDFTETYTPLICLSTVRMVLSKAATEDLEMRKIAVVTAYLKAEMKDELYMTLPKGFRAEKGRIVLDPEGIAPVYMRVKKSLYGLRQSGLNWYETVRDYFIGTRPTTHSSRKHNVFQQRISEISH
jgi:hypothetical protein